MSLFNRRRPTAEEVGELLEGDQFGSANDHPPSISDPITPTFMIVPIDQISTYDRNPRKHENTERGTIKAGILAKGGLDDTLRITRRPGFDLYMLSAGGNTRLECTRELLQETGDEGFSQIKCMFEPYQSESRLLFDHLGENTQRGALSLVDKAVGVRDLQLELQRETGKPLSQRDLVEACRAGGFAHISRTVLIELNYVVDRLLPYIPEALLGGLSGTKAKKIQRLDASFLSFAQHWAARQEGLTEPVTAQRIADACSALFSAVLTEIDQRGGVEIDAFEDKLLNAYAEMIGDSGEEIQRSWKLFAVDRAAVLVQQIAYPEQSATPPSGDSSETLLNAGLLHRPQGNPDSDAVEDIPPSLGNNNQEGDLPPSDGITNSGQPAIDAGRDGNLGDQPPPSESPSSVIDFAAPRRTIFGCAYQISRAMGFEDLIIETEAGFGYVCDVPRSPDQLTDETMRYAWWLLFSLSEVDQHLDQIHHIAPDSNLDAICQRLQSQHGGRQADDFRTTVIQVIDTHLGINADHVKRRQTLTDTFSAPCLDSLIRLITAIRSIKSTPTVHA